MIKTFEILQSILGLQLIKNIFFSLMPTILQYIGGEIFAFLAFLIPTGTQVASNNKINLSLICLFYLMML